MNTNEETNKLKFLVDDEHAGTPLKEILYDVMKLSSRLVRRAKRKKGILVNGHKIPLHSRLRRNDLVEVIMEDEPNQFEPDDINIEIVYEDVDLIIINKQPGLVVHPTKGHPRGTLANALVHHMNKSGNTFKIRFVNRLDRDTSGLIIVAKNSFGQQELSKQMQENKVDKYYLTVVEGQVSEDKGTIFAPIGREYEDSIKRVVIEGGQDCITHFKVKERMKKATVLEIKLETGRTHQIRVHMEYMGHALVGDELYGKISELIGRQALHAKRLAFNQPRTGERIVVDSTIPKDMENLINILLSN
jgi:23S rRNA pseudouridine1911/1915/1917 synthase